MSVDPKAILQRIESIYGPLAEGVPSVAYVYEPGVNGQCLYISPSIERVLWVSRRRAGSRTAACGTGSFIPRTRIA